MPKDRFNTDILNALLSCPFSYYFLMDNKFPERVFIVQVLIQSGVIYVTRFIFIILNQVLGRLRLRALLMMEFSTEQCELVFS